MEEQLREQVARGVAWSMAEKIGSMLSMTAVRLVILNLLEPRIFGCFAIPSAVAAVAMVVADSGFSQNLIRRRDPGPRDYKAVFVFNMALSSALYVLLALLAVLGVTSFNLVKKRMRTETWKKVQKGAYVFYGLIYIHVLAMLLPSAMNGGSAAVQSIAVYTAVFVVYAVARVTRAVMDKKRKQAAVPVG